MKSMLIFVVLLLISVFGLGLGLLYYMRPEKIVLRRIRKENWKAAEKDKEFKQLMEQEIDSQIDKTRRMGIILIIMEAIWLVVIFGLWQKSLGS